MASYNRSDIDRVIFISDIHLGVRNASIEWTENIISYFDNFFIPLIRKYKDNNEKIIVIIAGDFFDNRQHIDINVLNIGVSIIMKLSEECEVFDLIGNHDIYKKKDNDISSLILFKYLKNVKLIDEISSITFRNNKKMILIPWVGNHSEETKLISKYKNSDFIIMHTDISGLKFDNGREILDGVNVDVLTNCKIYSGHIHKRQESEKVTYLGSPYQLRRSDIGNEKGIYSLLFTDDSVKQEFLLNTYSPKFLKLRLVDILDLPMSTIKKIAENNYVDIIMKKSHKDDINISKLMDAMNMCNTKKIEIILDKNDDGIILDNTCEASKDITITDIFEHNIEQLGLSNEDINILKSMNSNYLTLAAEALGSDIEIK